MDTTVFAVQPVPGKPNGFGRQGLQEQKRDGSGFAPVLMRAAAQQGAYAVTQQEEKQQGSKKRQDGFNGEKHHDQLENNTDVRMVCHQLTSTNREISSLVLSKQRALWRQCINSK